jgi:hypothetical protein
VQVTVPAAPAAGVVHTPRKLGVADTNAAPAGSVIAVVNSSAYVEPAFKASASTVIDPPAATRGDAPMLS